MIMGDPRHGPQGDPAAPVVRLPGHETARAPAYVPPRHILLRRHTDAITGKDLAFLERALTRQLRDVAGFYGLPPPGVTVVLPEAEIPTTEAVGIDFADYDGLDGAVAHHGWSEAAQFPWSLVGVREAWSWTMAASHEAIEMFLNARLDRFVEGPLVMHQEAWKPTLWPFEAADMVESHGYPMSIEMFGDTRNVQLSNYVLPSYWRADGKPPPFDYLGVLTGPFTIAAGGYALIRNPDGAEVHLGATRRHMWTMQRQASRVHRLRQRGGQWAAT